MAVVRRIGDPTLAISVASTLALLSSPAYATDTLSPCDLWGDSQVVIIGYARAAEERTIVIASDVRPQRDLVTPIAIERAYKGTDRSEIFLRLPGDEPLPVGQRYVIYGNRDGIAEDVLLNPTVRNADQAEDDLRFVDHCTARCASRTRCGERRSQGFRFAS
jgi:hypothetical protein